MLKSVKGKLMAKRMTEAYEFDHVTGIPSLSNCHKNQYPNWPKLSTITCHRSKNGQ
jgi:hypothetical protein